MKEIICATLIFIFTSTSVFADWTLSQKTSQGGSKMGMITTIYLKGVRQRTEMKMDLDPQTAAAMSQMGSMASQMMPDMPIVVQQCDLKQDLYLSDRNKQYFIDYYDWSSAPPEKLARRGNQKITFKGTMTIDSWVVDSGKRQKMFGLDAKWLKWTQTIETSPDACQPSEPMKMEFEGWFVQLTVETQSCPINRPPPVSGGCMPKTVFKRLANPGFMLTGTRKSYLSGKLTDTSTVETLELSKATLAQALFDVPISPWIEVESMEALTKRQTKIDTSAKTVFSDGTKSQKTIAIDYFSGSVNKVDQDDLRNYLSTKVSSIGMSGLLVSSSSDIAVGNFANVIGVEIKKIKESGGAKIGGLFGKITGSSDMAKAGTSSAEIVVTLYGKDGKTAIISSPATAEVKGSANDAVKAAIDQVIGGVLAKAK